MNNQVLNIKGLHKKYKEKHVLKGIDLTINKGEIFGLLGPNGAGKSTLFKIILGLIEADEGSVEVLGSDIKKNRIEILSKTGSLIEAPSFYDHLSGYENLLIVSKMKNMNDKEHVKELLNVFKLYEDRNRAFKKYSLGMKQRLGLAAAFMNNPQLLILDEPTNGLDPQGVYEVKELIKKAPSIFNSTIILSSHILSEVEQMADHIGIIHKGEIKYQGLLSSLKNKQSLHIVEFSVNNVTFTEQLLRQSNYTFNVNNNIFSIEYYDESSLNDIQQLLVTNQIFIQSFQTKKQNLEEAYLDIIEQGAVSV
ncbi:MULTISPECIES: ABC transporter ATP-binding protein [unclassified Bacillus (in: firmicutes)]|uniref:ABC transporter ATP-binding protein n=1 Tax=unclassified Bacillus (in: firmicutes) TaxID=185979 RepID=UPI0008EE9917|nr:MULTISPECIES: ABC transporter ATP-binding protein [unclassified Bacillus (in: firmicutes)]SFJ59551.1 ABC-2 type transport system ATP-binding protein [Bacillus sp. 71mf]SFS68796.1 ABC-2 type transport system ATP-binding protein [Bacillus sp. 103mf]